MSWEEVIKKQSIRGLESLLSEKGSVDEIMRTINNKFNVKTKLFHPSPVQGQMHIGFNLPIYVTCDNSTKRDGPNALPYFNVHKVGIATSRTREYLKNLGR